MDSSSNIDTRRTGNAKRLFGTNGIRGIANVELTIELAQKVGMAVGTFFKGGRLTIGNDARISGPMMKMAVTSGLVACGCEVIDVGPAPTPAVEFLATQYCCAGGVSVTASHNPPEFNGIKVCDGKGVELPRENEEEIEQLIHEGKFDVKPWNALGAVVSKPNWHDQYVNMILQQVDASAIGKKNFNVVVDPGNSVGTLITPKLLILLGCTVQTINGELDGLFPGRNPEPTPESLGALSEAVRNLHADLGVAHDGDADRSVFVDECGQVIDGDKTFALIAKSFLKKNPRADIITPISSSQVVKAAVEASGGTLIYTKVGSIHISRKMLELRAQLGGEENGGIFYGPHQPVRDGAMSTALLLQTILEQDKPLSTMVSELPHYRTCKEKVPCPNKFKEEVMRILSSEVQYLKPETQDGVKIWENDERWVLVRPSGTEPVFRIFSEARDARTAEDMIRKYRARLVQIIQGMQS